MENPQTLRYFAEWYRNFAEVGRTDQREARLKMAEHLERRATEIEAATEDKAR